MYKKFRKVLQILKMTNLEIQKAYFYIHKSGLNFEMVYPAAVVIASKATDLKLRDILNVFYYLVTGKKLEIDKEYWELRDGLLNTERILLRAIGFQIEVDDLMLDLCCYCEDHRIDRLTWQTSIAILNSSLDRKEVVMKGEIVDGRSEARQVTMAMVSVAELFVKENVEEIDRIRKGKAKSRETKNGKERVEKSSNRMAKSQDAHEFLVKIILEHLMEEERIDLGK